MLGRRFALMVYLRSTRLRVQGWQHSRNRVNVVRHRCFTLITVKKYVHVNCCWDIGGALISISTQD